MLHLVSTTEKRLRGMEESAQQYTAYQHLFAEAPEDYGSLLHVRREFERRKLAWKTLSDWMDKSHEWMHRCALKAAIQSHATLIYHTLH